MAPFDTGDPNAKVYYQELISKEEAQISAGFLEIDHSSFDWELTYEEIDYVISGTLEITIEGQTFTANPGDVVFVPKDSKVTWCSPNKVKLFYATYPANWPDLLWNPSNEPWLTLKEQEYESIRISWNKGLLAAVEASDVMLKTAEVTLTQKEVVGGGLVTIMVQGM